MYYTRDVSSIYTHTHTGAPSPRLEMINYRIAFEIFKEPGARAVAFRRSRTARYLSFFSPFHHRPVPPTGQDCTPRYSRQPAAVRSSSSSRGRYLRRVTLLHGVRISAARESHPKCPFNAAAGIYRVTLIYYAYIYIYIEPRRFYCSRFLRFSRPGDYRRAPVSRFYYSDVPAGVRFVFADTVAADSTEDDRKRKTTAITSVPSKIHAG